MKALTVIQPWAWLIATGQKLVENRSWKPPEHMIGQRIALHAGKKRNSKVDIWLEDSLDILTPEELDIGAIVATVRIAGVITLEEQLAPAQRQWFCGPFGWVFDQVAILDEPILDVNGQLGLWNVPDDVLVELKERHLALRIVQQAVSF